MVEEFDVNPSSFIVDGNLISDQLDNIEEYTRFNSNLSLITVPVGVTVPVGDTSIIVETLGNVSNEGIGEYPYTLDVNTDDSIWHSLYIKGSGTVVLSCVERNLNGVYIPADMHTSTPLTLSDEYQLLELNSIIGSGVLASFKVVTNSIQEASFEINGVYINKGDTPRTGVNLVNDNIANTGSNGTTKGFISYYNSVLSVNPYIPTLNMGYGNIPPVPIPNQWVKDVLFLKDTLAIQGITSDTTYFYGTSTTDLYKYDSNFYTILTALNTVDLVDNSVHQGDPACYDDKLYIPCFEPLSGVQHCYIGVFSATDLSFISSHEVSEMLPRGLAALAIDPINEIIYLATDVSVLKYDLNTFAYIEEVTLNPSLVRIQGIEYYNEQLYISTDGGVGHLDNGVHLYNTDGTFVSNIIIPLDVGEIEGLCINYDNLYLDIAGTIYKYVKE